MSNAFVKGQTEQTYPSSILRKEIIGFGDPRESLFTDSQRKELVGLMERDAFRDMLKEEAEPSANVLPSRYVIDIKHADNNETTKFCKRDLFSMVIRTVPNNKLSTTPEQSGQNLRASC